jgi:hypothetical protein
MSGYGDLFPKLVAQRITSQSGRFIVYAPTVQKRTDFSPHKSLP